MDNKRVLLITGASDSEKLSNNYDSWTNVLNKTLPSKERYAKKHNYDYYVLRSFGSDKHNKLQRTDNHIGFLRVLNSFILLENYDIVMWIDGDSIITNENMKLEDFGIDDEHCFYASWDWMHKTPYTNGHGYHHAFSLGNFIITNTKHTFEFYNTFCQLAKHFSDEQQTLNMIYAGTELSNKIKILDHKYLGGAPVELQLHVGGRQVIEPWSPEYFLCHFTGMSNKHRLDLMNNKFKEYL